MATQRYNSGIQRAKGLLEIAAALYDTSLSHHSERATMFTVAAVLRAAGFSLADIRKWGGKIHSVPRPSDPCRRAAIQNGTINAVFDEGIKSLGRRLRSIMVFAIYRSPGTC
jgi:hypothetical protein